MRGQKVRQLFLERCLVIARLPYSTRFANPVSVYQSLKCGDSRGRGSSRAGRLFPRTTAGTNRSTQACSPDDVLPFRSALQKVNCARHGLVPRAVPALRSCSRRFGLVSTPAACRAIPTVVDGVLQIDECLDLPDHSRVRVAIEPVDEWTARFQAGWSVWE